ncbi:MAG: IS3 family transposase [Pseudonocardiales bacterium]|nr:MAG: IS3 family transposase [Pseudonocardiales bacterium]
MSEVFSFIAAEKANYPASLMCRVLGVNRTSFHDWQRRAPSDRTLYDAWLTEQIKQIHVDSAGTYGAPRVHAELRLCHRVRVGEKRVARLMATAGLEGIPVPRKARTTLRVAGVRCAPDLVERDFNASAPDRLWCADITQLSTWEGWLYLASVIDCFSRRVVGWSMASHMRLELVEAALGMAVARRHPQRGLIHHSDHGSQYTAVVFGERCSQAGIDVSMGSIGDCFDNAVCEAFHSTLKRELVHRRPWPTAAELKTAVFEYIEGFYNTTRRHSTLGYHSPSHYESLHQNRLSPLHG